MQSLPEAAVNHAANDPPPQADVVKRNGWSAHLSLGFTAVDQRSVLTTRRHQGPLVVQKTLYPEGLGICHAIVVHPPGGIAGGDQLELSVNMGPGAHALLTTPGAGKWYKSNGNQASQQLKFNVAQDAVVEWLPQETILFDAAQARLETHVDMTGNAVYAGWEITCFGRQAAGERFQQGALLQRTQLYRDGKRIWAEFADLQAGSAVMHSAVGLNGATVHAGMLIAAGLLPAELLEACRAVHPSDGAVSGVTALPDVFAARYLGTSAQHARHYFEAVWAIVRPWYAGVAANRPRIWNT